MDTKQYHKIDFSIANWNGLTSVLLRKEKFCFVSGFCASLRGASEGTCEGAVNKKKKEQLK